LLRGAGSPQPRAELKTRWIAGGRRLASPIDGQEAIDPICRAGAASRPRWGLAEVDCLVPAGVTGEAGSCVTGSDGRRPDQQAEACLAGASGADARRPGGHDRDHAADPALQAVGLPLAEAADDDSGRVSATPSTSSSR
jgi:hypothetical protein